MAVKLVKEYEEEMCDICLDHKYGKFVKKNDTNICEECCKDIYKELKTYEMVNE